MVGRGIFLFCFLCFGKEEDFSVLPACFTIQLSPMLCRVVISYNMLNVSLILLIFYGLYFDLQYGYSGGCYGLYFP